LAIKYPRAIFSFFEKEKEKKKLFSKKKTKTKKLKNADKKIIFEYEKIQNCI
jgi:hypothetical protein